MQFLEIKSEVDAEKIKNQEKLESQNLQKSIYKWLLKKEMKRNLFQLKYKM
jgi:hypothetical protein